MTIQVTPAARAHILKSSEAPVSLRLWLKVTGCAGFSYDLSFDNARDGDITYAFEGFAIHIPQQDAARLAELVIDCETNVTGSRMVFHNPRETARCGCGLSVELKEFA